MGTTVSTRKVTAFRLDTGLLERLKAEAKRENRSLNNLVETLLFIGIDRRRPNPDTLAAIEEARSGKYAGEIDTSSMEAFIKSIEGDE